MQTTFGINAGDAVVGGGGVVGGGVVGGGVVVGGVVVGAVDGGVATVVPDDSEEPHAIEIGGKEIRTNATARLRAARSGTRTRVLGSEPVAV
jgi:hypothetical protein